MTSNSAACFLLCGLALLIIVLRGPHWLVILCAGAASVVSLLTIAEYVFHVHLGIDELLGGMVLMPSAPGRMAPVAAIGFALGSLGLVLSPSIPSRPTALCSGLTGSIIVAVSIVTCVAFALDDPRVDPRVRLAIELAAECRTGQALACTRTVMTLPALNSADYATLPAGSLGQNMIPGAGKKHGEIVIFTPDRRHSTPRTTTPLASRPQSTSTCSAA
jgi:hypothetical protein